MGTLIVIIALLLTAPAIIILTMFFSMLKGYRKRMQDWEEHWSDLEGERSLEE